MLQWNDFMRKHFISLGSQKGNVVMLNKFGFRLEIYIRVHL